MPIILIGGVPRIGKSRLARQIAAHTRFDVIHCDRFRKSFWSIVDEQKRSSERFRHYEEAIAGRSGGLIIEGDDLICRNRGDTALAQQGLISNDNTLSLGLLEHLRTHLGATTFTAGCIEADPASMAAAIRRHSTETCFTTALSDQGLNGFVRGSIKRSERLKAMADEARIPYLEMGGNDFAGAIDAAAGRILHELDRQAA